jgi:hypothetical protein
MQFGKEIIKMSKIMKMVLVLIGSVILTGLLYDVYLPLMFSMLFVDIILCIVTVLVAEQHYNNR